MAPTDDGWKEWSKHVLLELERLDTCITRLDEKLDATTIEVAKLHVKASVWGAVGGVATVLTVVLLTLARKWKLF